MMIEIIKMKRILFLISLVSLILTNKISIQSSIQTNIYFKMSGLNNYQLDNSFMIKSFDSKSILRCFSSCSSSPSCFYIIFQQNKCYICNFLFANFASYTNAGNSLIYKKKLITTANSLINYWSFNGNVNDSIGNAHLYNGYNAVLTYDRFGRPNSALSLTNGYYKIPPGVYTSGTQFTLMGWVKMRNIRLESRMFDFGNGAGNQNIVLSLTDTVTSNKPYVYFLSGNLDFYGYSTVSFNLNKWQHLACVFSFPYYSILIDGIETTLPGSMTNLNSFNVANVVRSSNFIGRSNWYSISGAQDADADFDDLKIFNRALTQQEIQYEMIND